MTLYLENYFEGLQRLPSELFASMKELRSLDDKVADNLRHVSNRSHALYNRSYFNLTGRCRDSQLSAR